MKLGLLVDINALFDTRLGAVLLTHPVSNLKKDFLMEHQQRTKDEWRNRKNDVIQARYKQQDRELLRNSVVTRVVKFIDEYVKTTMINNMNLPNAGECSVHINVYPYQLEQSEMDVIEAAMRVHTNHMVDIHVFYQPWKSIKPSWLKDNIALMIIYRFDEWLFDPEVDKELMGTPIPDITIITPKIQHMGSNMITPEQKRLMKQQGIDAYGLVKDALLIYIHLEFHEVGLFSVAV